MALFFAPYASVIPMEISDNFWYRNILREITAMGKTCIFAPVPNLEDTVDCKIFTVSF
jgi:hypothetical protein